MSAWSEALTGVGRTGNAAGTKGGGRVWVGAPKELMTGWRESTGIADCWADRPEAGTLEVLWNRVRAVSFERNIRTHQSAERAKSQVLRVPRH